MNLKRHLKELKPALCANKKSYDKQDVNNLLDDIKGCLLIEHKNLARYGSEDFSDYMMLKKVCKFLDEIIEENS